MANHNVGRVGEEIGPYRLTRLLGAGGFGEVYEAEHRLIQQRRAIKLLLERHFHDPKARERFLREARTLAGLDHPNILPVLEVDEAGDLLYLVMPLYQRGTLNDLLKQQTAPLPLAEVEQYLAQICVALGYAHARGIAHLDLKPENLLLHEDGRLVLADFGLAHLLKQGRLEAGTSASWGTPYYMAPEQIQGNPEPRSDLYALGVILYQLLTMQRPFTGATPEAVMMKHALEAPPALQAAYPAAPAALEPVIQKALAKQPADRYQTAGALVLDFRAALGGPAASSTQPPAPAAAPVAPAPPMPDPTLGARPTVPAALNTPPAVAAGCQIPLPDGNLCGIPPIGRCATCGRAFCTSHQGREHDSWYTYADMCVECFAKTPKERGRAKKEESIKAAQYLQGAAKTALLTARVPTVEISWHRQQWEPKRGPFSRGGQYVDVEIPVGRGWILGTFTWTVRNSQGYAVTEDCLTALLNFDPGSEKYRNSYPGGEEFWHHCLYRLTCVQRVPDGYKVLESDVAHLSGVNSEVFIQAMQAVKRLAGESN